MIAQLLRKRHLKSVKHHRAMLRAEVLTDAALRLRDEGKGIQGFQELQNAIKIAITCGCQEEEWPANLNELVGR